MTLIDPTRLLLVRHGQSEWNAEGRWQGQADSPLSELGRQQAFSAAKGIGSVDVIVSSPQSRALETARIVSEQIGVGPVQLVDDLRERSAGIWSGFTHAEIERKWPGWIDSGRRPDDFEDDASLETRSFAALRRIAAECPGAEVLAVCHGGVIKTIEKVLGVEAGRVPNLAGRVVQFSGGDFRPGERLQLLEDSAAAGERNSSDEERV